MTIILKDGLFALFVLSVEVLMVCWSLWLGGQSLFGYVVGLNFC